MGKKILFIEDEPALQEAFTEFFKKAGFDVYSAFDGVSGLEAVKKHIPDLILLDIILPKKDGFAVLAELKKDKALNTIPVIVLTNLEDPENIHKALEAGAIAYLLKTSYRLEEVLEKVRLLLDKPSAA